MASEFSKLWVPFDHRTRKRSNRHQCFHRSGYLGGIHWADNARQQGHPWHRPSSCDLLGLRSRPLHDLIERARPCLKSIFAYVGQTARQSNVTRHPLSSGNTSHPGQTIPSPTSWTVPAEQCIKQAIALSKSMGVLAALPWDKLQNSKSAMRPPLFQTRRSSRVSI